MKAWLARISERTRKSTKKKARIKRALRKQIEVLLPEPLVIEEKPDYTATGEKDYVQIAIDYANEAIADTKHERFCKNIVAAAHRFLMDLNRAELSPAPFRFSRGHADHACQFIEQLPHVEGNWHTENIVLVPAQVFVIVQLFGFRNHDNTRRFTTVLYSVARKNAKSTLAAAIQIYCLVEEGENGPQVLSAATTGDQARIVWRIAHRMIEKTLALQEYYHVEPFANTITCWENGGIYRPINSKASTQDGLNPSCLCFDELHAHKNHDLYNVLRSAAGARDNPLFLYTTTEGFETQGPWADVRNFAESVLKGVIEADHFLAIFYTLDEEDDDFDETKWIKANPLLGISVSLKKLREYSIEAKQQPGARGEFRIKRLNRRSSAAKAWTDLLLWNRCAGEVHPEELADAECWGSFDLASTQDMCAWRLLWRKEGKFYTWGRFWVPENAVKFRTERGTTRYDPWKQSGHLTVTEGNVADYDVIEDTIYEDIMKFKPKKVAFDSWNATSSVNRLTKRLRGQKVEFEQFIQGTRSFSPAMRTLDVAYRSNMLVHDANPILTWNMSNMVARTDPNLNMAPDRGKSSEKIDGAVALLMCFGLAALEMPKAQPKYQMMVLSGSGGAK